MKRILIALFLSLFAFSAHSNVIEVVDIGDGYYQIFSDGESVGTLTKAGADKIIDKYRKAGNTINSTTSNPRPKGFDFNKNTNNSNSGGKSGTNSNSQKSQSNSGTKNSSAGTSGASSSGNTNKNTTGAGAKSTNPGTNANAGRTKTPPKSSTKALPEPKSTAVTKSTGNAVTKSGGQTTTKTSPKSGGGGGKAGTGMAVIGGVISAVDFADNEKSKSQKTTWADVGRAAADGAGMAAGVAAIANAIPGAGQVAYAGAIAVGAVLGAMSSARKMFSETDCEWDSIIGKYNCCNISKISNIDAKRSTIGESMPCYGRGDYPFPFIRKCVQGKKEHDSNQGVKGLFMDDHWANTCDVGFCKEMKAPRQYIKDGKVNEDFKILTYWVEGKGCWAWTCPDFTISKDGFCSIKQNDSAPSSTSSSNKTTNDARGEIGQKEENTNYKICEKNGESRPCVGDDMLPQKAKTGECVSAGRKDYKICIATECKPGFTVKKIKEKSYGFCITKAEQGCIDSVGDKKWNSKASTCDCGEKVWNNESNTCQDKESQKEQMNEVIEQPADPQNEENNCDKNKGLQPSKDDPNECECIDTGAKYNKEKDKCEPTESNTDETAGETDEENESKNINYEEEQRRQAEEEARKKAEEGQKRLEEEQKKTEEEYKSARDNEQSDANKALTAAAVAAGGLGAMEWASGRAEQRADAAAEREMSAYIATMKCEYGGGQQVNLGATETLPGGNEMFSYKTEFKQLAEKLKATKTALNLRPGIEAEVVYDRAETGLYDYQSAETGGGANPSLSRALMNPDGTDAAAWNAQKQEAADKAQGGRTATGIGVIGGAVGNAAINTDVIKNVVEKIRK